jgi:hypothetical protein
MNRLISFIFGVSIFCVSAAQAMPFHSNRAGLVIPVGSECGIGVDRGPYDGCGTVYRAYPHNAFQTYSSYGHGYEDDYYYVGPRRSLMVDQGQCSGRGIYRVCNVYGQCWAHCY